MKNNSKASFDDEDGKRMRRVEKGSNKLDKHKKRIYNMATSLDLDDEAFDEYLDHEEVTFRRLKLR